MLSPLFSTTVFATTLLAMATIPGLAAPDQADLLSAHRWKARVLIVLSPTSTDPKLQQQQRTFSAMKAGASERDLILVESIGSGPAAQALRNKLGLDGGFHAVLVGKDGGSKLVSAEPLGPDALFPVIDAMPMRQQEMQER